MKKVSILLSILFITQFAIAQTDTNLVISETYEEPQLPFLIAEVDAMPLIGLKEWYIKVSDYCKENYPERAIKAGIQGKVYVSFVIEKDSSLSDVKLLRGNHDLIDKVALDAILVGGKWKPAKQGGKAVRMMKRMPINFKIPENKNKNKNMPVAKIGDMELMKFIHQQSKKYSVKKEISGEEIVMVRVMFDDKGFIKKTIIVKSSNEKLSKIALKYVISYKEGWILPIGDNAEKESIVLPVIFSTKLNLDNL